MLWCHCLRIDYTFLVHLSLKNYLRLKVQDSPGVIGGIGSIFGHHGVSIQSIVQFDASEAGAEIVVITHKVKQGQITASLKAIQALEEVKGLSAQMVCI